MRTKLLLSSLLVVAFATVPAQAGSPARASVTVKDFSYSPSTVTIKKGGTVVWTWRGRIMHDVYSKGHFKSPLKSAGTWSQKFSRTGTYSYYCTLHPSMQGKVIVRSS